MSDVIEKQIKSLLNGLSLTENRVVSTQNETTNGNGSTTEKDASTLPICQKTVTYIVAAVVVNDEDQVLMIQEAKSSCSGEWYLPAGRVEKNENLIEAVKREVSEETGLILEPSTLIMVESASSSWFRFVFTGEIIGGQLKTPDQADNESLQAMWIHNIQDLQLRSNDILPLIERARNYRSNVTIQHPMLLPVVKPFNKLFLRLMITAKKKSTNKLNMLVSNGESQDFPMCEMNSNKSVLSTLRHCMMEIFGDQVPQHRPHGLFAVEFSGGLGGDGICLTVLVTFKVPCEEISIISDYLWHQVSENMEKMIIIRLPRHMTVPLNVIR